MQHASALFFVVLGLLFVYADVRAMQAIALVAARGDVAAVHPPAWMIYLRIAAVSAAVVVVAACHIVSLFEPRD